MAHIISTCIALLESREGIALQLFAVSLLLIVIVSKRTSSIWQEPIGPFLAVPVPTLEAFPHAVSGDRKTFPVQLDGVRWKMSFDLLGQAESGRSVAKKAFEQPVIIRVRMRAPALSKEAEAVAGDWSAKTGEELAVIGVSPQTFERLNARNERLHNGQAADHSGLIVRLRARLPLNPIDILLHHPDHNVRLTALVMVLPLWFGLIQQYVLR